MTTLAPDSERIWLIDIHALLVRALRADQGVTAITGQRIYARNYHERQQWPACRITFPAATGVTVPSPAWWDYDGQVDCHADNHQQAGELAAQVQRALWGLTGTTHPEGWIASMDVWNVQSGFDEEHTPSKPRWIVAASITARAR
jgi:hypothetical protein